MQSFIRVHRTHLINKSFVQKYQSINRTAAFVHLANGEKIGVSRRKQTTLKKAFKIFTWSDVLAQPCEYFSGT
jgi:DNA-binding LytR/AlgR family response regulator